jgi:hypothetical protein
MNVEHLRPVIVMAYGKVLASSACDPKNGEVLDAYLGWADGTY